jgi:hypothetical protein
MRGVSRDVERRQALLARAAPVRRRRFAPIRKARLRLGWWVFTVH